MGPRVVGACCGWVVVRAQARVPVPLKASCVGLHLLASPKMAKGEPMAHEHSGTTFVSDRLLAGSGLDCR
jgi:hypothetical protein